MKVKSKKSKSQKLRVKSQRTTIYDPNFETPHAAKTAQQSMIPDVAKQSNSIICATTFGTGPRESTVSPGGDHVVGRLKAGLGANN
jgi:hypothetical protein